MTLSAEQESQLVDRLYTQSLSRKEATMAELQARYYPVAAPSTISEEELQKSVKRQVDDEMEQRRQRRVEMDAMAAGAATGYPNRQGAKATSGKAISPAEVEASVQRLYDETLARNKANMAESEKRYAFHPDSIKTKKLAKDEFKASVERMSQPKKTEYSVAEVNKIYGL